MVRGWLQRPREVASGGLWHFTALDEGARASSGSGRHDLDNLRGLFRHIAHRAKESTEEFLKQSDPMVDNHNVYSAIRLFFQYHGST